MTTRCQSIPRKSQRAQAQTRNGTEWNVSRCIESSHSHDSGFLFYGRHRCATKSANWTIFNTNLLYNMANDGSNGARSAGPSRSRQDAFWLRQLGSFNNNKLNKLMRNHLSELTQKIFLELQRALYLEFVKGSTDFKNAWKMCVCVLVLRFKLKLRACYSTARSTVTIAHRLPRTACWNRSPAAFHPQTLISYINNDYARTQQLISAQISAMTLSHRRASHVKAINFPRNQFEFPMNFPPLWKCR